MGVARIAFQSDRRSFSNLVRLMRLEGRRNVAFRLVHFTPALALLLALQSDGMVSFLWTDAVVLAQGPLLFIGPLIAGAAAWMGYRERRRGTEDLVASTSLPTTGRRLALLAATTFWGLIVYAAYAGYVLGRTALQATWGGPDLRPLAVGVVAIVAQAAVGFALGVFLPGRLTAPLVAIAAFGSQAVAANSMNWVSYLPPDRSPHTNLVPRLDVFHAPTFDPTWGQLLFYLGLALMALAALTLPARWSAASWAGVTLGVALAVWGVVSVWGAVPRWSDEPWMPTLNGWGKVVPEERLAPYEPVCTDGAVRLCVHPAYRPLLPEAEVWFERMTAPLAGLPGVPGKVEAKTMIRGAGFGELGAYLGGASVAVELVANRATLMQGSVQNDAQAAVRDWLMMEADFHWVCEGYERRLDYVVRNRCAAAHRLSRLPDSERQAWLEANYARLRAGELKLEDMP